MAVLPFENTSAIEATWRLGSSPTQIRVVSAHNTSLESGVTIHKGSGFARLNRSAVRPLGPPFLQPHCFIFDAYRARLKEMATPPRTPRELIARLMDGYLSTQLIHMPQH
jgi:hypothetical protein